MKRVIGLIRLSTEEQAREGRAGILRQRHDIATAERAHGLEVVRQVEMVGLSGTDVLHNADFQQVMADLSHPDIDGIACSSIDRLVRPGMLGDLAVFDPFQRHKKLIYTPGQAIDLNTQSGFLMSGVLGVMGGVERQWIIQRAQDGKESLRKQGRHPNGDRLLPRGVAYDRATGKWSYTEPWASKVKLAFDLLLQGEPYRVIAERTGYSTRGIQYALRNPIWAGVRCYSKRCCGPKRRLANGKTYRAPVPREEPLEVRVIDKPLIPRSRWEDAQKVLQERHGHWTKNNDSADRRFLASGILRDSCGQPWYQHCATRKQGFVDYYLCGGRKAKKCNAPYLRRTQVDSTIERLLSEHLVSEPVLAKILAGMVSAKPNAAAPKLQRELARLEANRKRLVDLAVNGSITRTEFDDRVRVLDHEIRQTRALAPSEVPAGLHPKRLAAVLYEIFKYFGKLPFTEKRGLLRRACREITIRDGGIIAVTFSGGFVAECKNLGNSSARIAAPSDIRESSIEGTRKYGRPFSLHPTATQMRFKLLAAGNARRQVREAPAARNALTPKVSLCSPRLSASASRKPRNGIT